MPAADPTPVATRPDRSKQFIAFARQSGGVIRQLPLFRLATALSWFMLALGLVAILKPTWLYTPKTVTSAVRDEVVNNVNEPTQSVTTTRFATIGTKWVLQRERQTRIVRSGGLPESNVREPLVFADPGTFVTDADARRFRLPGFYYGYQGRAPGGSVLLESRAEVNVSVWWIVGIFGILPAIWLVRLILRIRNAKAASKP